MEIYLANLIYDNGWNVNVQEYLEEYTDLIWTKRWQAYGDFILKIPISAIKTISNYSDLIDKILVLRGKMSEDMSTNIIPDDYMLIEKVTLTYDAYANEILVIEGRDLSSILSRRIIWGQVSFRSNQMIKSAVDSIVTSSIVNPSDSDRRIDGFVIDAYEASDTIDSMQRSFSNLFDVIIELCGENYSPDVVLDSKLIKFKLYAGADRTLKSNNPLIFSERLDNLVKYEYLKNVTDYKNAWLCAGEGEGASRITVSDKWSDGVGLARRERYIDARNISSQDSSGTVPSSTYKKMLQSTIKNKCLATQVKEACTAELIFDGVKYGTDYSVGDCASVVDTLGNTHNIRITEFIRSDGVDGYNEYPNFELIGGTTNE